MRDARTTTEASADASMEPLTRTQIVWFAKKIALDAPYYAHGICHDQLREFIEAESGGAVHFDAATEANLRQLEDEANAQYWRVAKFLGYEEGMHDTFPDLRSCAKAWDAPKNGVLRYR